MLQIDFAYDLGTTVYFWKDGKGYQGQIIRRGYIETLSIEKICDLVGLDAQSDDKNPGVNMYHVKNSEVDLAVFYEYQFGEVIFTDAGELAKKYLLIK